MEPYSRPGNPNPNPNHNLRAAGTPPGAGASVMSTIKALKLCYDFNKKDGCPRKDCKFKHACSFYDKKLGKDSICMDTSHNLVNHK